MQVPLNNANAACVYFSAGLLKSQCITIETFSSALCMHVEQSTAKISDKFSYSWEVFAQELSYA